MDKKVKQSDGSPLIVFLKGDSHENAASILLANVAHVPLKTVIIKNYYLVSFDDVVDSGYTNKVFEIINPFQVEIIASLSSFDLDFENHYTIEFISEDKINRMNFTLNKYGKFEQSLNCAESELKYGGKIIKTYNF